jgi:alanine-synthesizing transaminase
MNFSERTAWNLTENDLTNAIRSARSQGRDFCDLTASNPTACGFAQRPDLLKPLADPAAAIYVPDAFGMAAAREAVAGYYRDLGAEVARERICLTTSTSEAYSYLFRLLCDPGDEVLVASPSYPLFDFIALLDGVRLRQFPLHYDPNADTNTAIRPDDAGGDHAGWSIDMHALEELISPRTRAVIVVHPNNPTGSYASQAERNALRRVCAEHGLALIVDEVFLDYALGRQEKSFVAEDCSCLTFVLSGLSKVCALPQMKCSWIAACGPEELLKEAMARLEVIADTFLSMNAPVQHALPVWLGGRGEMQRQIVTRMRGNLAELDRRLRGTLADRLALQGGWTVVLRVPRTVEGVAFAEAALERDVIVQPGEFYGMSPARVVLSLLTPPEIWQRGLAALPIE